MTEIIQEVRNFVVNFLCEECNNGIMMPTGQQFPNLLQGQPPLHGHVCVGCGHRKALKKQYPGLMPCPVGAPMALSQWQQENKAMIDAAEAQMKKGFESVKGKTDVGQA